MDLFTNLELKTIAKNAIGNLTSASSKKINSIKKSANAAVDAKVSEKIKAESTNTVSGIQDKYNQPDNLFPGTPEGVKSPNTSTIQGSQPGNIMSQLQTTPANNITNTGTGNVPSIPQLPSLDIDIDPSKYIPDMSSIPYSALIKPLVEAALSAALSKLNVSSFIQQAQGKLGSLSEKTTSNLQGLEQKVQGGAAAASQKQNEAVQNQLVSQCQDLEKKTKEISSQAEEVKVRISNYIEMFFLKTSNPQVFNLDPRKQDFLLIDGAV